MSEKLGIFISTNWKEGCTYVCEMMTLQKEMGKGFNLQTTQVQRVYTILEIMFEFMSIKVT